MKLCSSALTHVGRRSNNEDSLGHEPRLGLYAVADGLGGYEGGEVASSLAIQTLIDFVRRNQADDDVTWPYKLDRRFSLDENLALTAARLAHEQIVYRKHGRLTSMGSTLALLLVRGARAVIAHIGDSRVYRLRHGQLQQLTRDHSLYEELLASGMPDLPPKEQFAHANIITRALGISGSAEARTESLELGDIYLLCTDGLLDGVREAEIAATLASLPPAEACAALISAAYEAGSRDNITAVVLHCDP